VQITVREQQTTWSVLCRRYQNDSRRSSKLVVTPGCPQCGPPHTVQQSCLHSPLAASHVFICTRNKSEVLEQSHVPRGPLGGATDLFQQPSARHQLTLRDHGYGANASCGVSVYFPAVRPIPLMLLCDRGAYPVRVPGLRIDPLHLQAGCRKRRLNHAPLNLRGLI